MLGIMTILLQATAAFLLATLLFDFIHYLMHRFMKSNFIILRKIGSWHSVHHRFFPSDLTIKKEWAESNLYRHVTLEYLVQIIGIFICGFFINIFATLLAFLFSTIIFIMVWRNRGEDKHHRSYTILPAHSGGLFVSAHYHALHHVYPNNFFSSYIKVLDYILGAGIQITGKQIVMTGANGALGMHMKKLLIEEGATVSTLKFGVDYDYDHYEHLQPILHRADILLLCHGSKYHHAQEANCESFIKLIEFFKTRSQKTFIPLEIWAVGSEIECHPYFGIKKLKPYALSKRNFAKKARYYFYDQNIQYRHLVHSAFTSQMGPGLMSAKFAAFITFFLLKRGFKYVPVTYTGFAFLNYVRFALARFTKPSAP